MAKTLTLLLAAVALGAAVAGCGSSAAQGIVQAPSAGATADSTTATAPSSSSSTTSTTSTASVTTPTTGPLSKEPTIAAGKGSPPKTLQTKDIVKGTGAVAKAGSTVTVNYVGALYKNGKVFDASWTTHKTYSTVLSSGPTGVIPGWVRGIRGMRVGGRRQLIIPPKLAYGNAGRSPVIPPDATLIFDIDLLSVRQ